MRRPGFLPNSNPLIIINHIIIVILILIPNTSREKNTTLDHWTNWTLPKKHNIGPPASTSRGKVSVETRRPAHDQVGEEASAGHKILTLDQPGPMDREWPWNHHTHDWPKNQVILEIESPGNLDSKPANR